MDWSSPLSFSLLFKRPFRLLWTHPFPLLAGLRNIPAAPRERPIQRQEMTDYVGQTTDAVAQAFTGFGDQFYALDPYAE